MEYITHLGEWILVRIPKSMGSSLYLPWVLLCWPTRHYEVIYANSSDYLQLFSSRSPLGSYWLIMPLHSLMDSSSQSIWLWFLCLEKTLLIGWNKSKRNYKKQGWKEYRTLWSDVVLWIGSPPFHLHELEGKHLPIPWSSLWQLVCIYVILNNLM